MTKTRQGAAKTVQAMAQLNASDGEETSHKHSVPILNEKNYLEWETRVKAFLMKKGVYKGILSAQVASDDVEALAQQKALGIILEHLTSEQMHKYINDTDIETPKQLLDQIKANQLLVNEPVIRDLRCQISTFVWKSTNVVQEYRRMYKIVQEFQGAGGVLDGKVIVQCWVQCVPRRFIDTADKIVEDGINSLETAKTRLEIKDRRISLSSSIRTMSSITTTTKAENKRKPEVKKERKSEIALTVAQFTCKVCNKKGCFKKACRQEVNRRKQLALQQGDADKSQESKPEVAMMTYLVSSSDEDTWEPTLNTNTDMKPKLEVISKAYSVSTGEHEWILDSGASCHMTGKAQLFQELHNIMEDRYVQVASGQYLKVKGIGAVKLWANGMKMHLKLKDVLYVPGLGKNLFSVNNTVMRGVEVHFGLNGVSIRKNGQEVVHVIQQDGLYILDTARPRGRQEKAMAVTTKESELEEHLKTCHFSSAGRENCIACKQGKLTRIISKQYNETKAKKVLELVHTDSFAVTTPSNSGFNGGITFIDDYSRYASLYFYKKKNDAEECIKKYIEWAERQTGNKLITL